MIRPNLQKVHCKKKLNRCLCNLYADYLTLSDTCMKNVDNNGKNYLLTEWVISA